MKTQIKLTLEVKNDGLCIDVTHGLANVLFGHVERAILAPAPN